MTHAGRRCTVLSLAAVCTLAACIWLSGWPTPPSTRAAGNVIIVHLGESIQTAIDTAQDGDKVWVQEGSFTETLRITKPITLAGSWDPDCEHCAGPTTLNANGGRGISITLPISTGVVSIISFNIVNGDASGLGGYKASDSDSLPAPSRLAAAAPSRSSTSPADWTDQFAVARASVSRDFDAGLFPPDGAAYRALVARLATAQSLANTPIAAPQTSRAGALGEEPVRLLGDQPHDCGGGLYSWNARLFLSALRFENNVASRTTSGLGGGACIGQAPAGGVEIWSTVFEANTATQAVGAAGYGGGLFLWNAGTYVKDVEVTNNTAGGSGPGFGGGVFIGSERGDSLTIQGETRFEGNAAGTAAGAEGRGGAIAAWNAGLNLDGGEFSTNVAARSGAGMGGAVYLAGAPAGSSSWRDSYFTDNRAAVGTGAGGLGGAACITGTQAAAVQVLTCTLSANIASNSGRGEGGGLYAAGAPGLVISGSTFRGNLGFAGGLLAHGAGLAVIASSDVHVEHNAFENNRGLSVFGGSEAAAAGGGAFLMGADRAVVADNTFVDNLGALVGRVAGGGLAVWNGDGAWIADNILRENQATLFQTSSSALGAFGGGGGLALVHLSGATVVSNTLTGNTGCISAISGAAADLDSMYGGGLLGKDIQGSVITGNLASGNVAGTDWSGNGGGIAVLQGDGVIIANNVVRDNRGSLGHSGLGGGILLSKGTANSAIRRNWIEGNRAGADDIQSSGGGIHCGTINSFNAGGEHALTLDGNIVLRNDASTPIDGGENGGEGGGIMLSMVENFTVTNNVFAGNRGLWFADSLAVVDELHVTRSGGLIANNTLADNAGTAIGVAWYSAPVDIINNLVASAESAVHIEKGNASGRIGYLLLDDATFQSPPSGITVDHVISGTAQFVNAAADNYRIRGTSAARDAGDPAGIPPAPAYDADGYVRPFGPHVDIGAYEWHGGLYFLPYLVRAQASPARAAEVIAPRVAPTQVVTATVDVASTRTSDAAQWSVSEVQSSPKEGIQ